MTSGSSPGLGTSLLQPPSDQLVKSLLKRTNSSKSGQRAVLRKWDELQKHQPSIAQFIRITTHQLEPGNTAARERLAGAMVKLYMLLEEARLQKDITEVWSESLAGYFPLGG